MCCGFEAWTNGEDPFCFLMRGGVQEDQTEDLEAAVFSSLVFQFESLEEPDFLPDSREPEEEFEDDWYGKDGCDW